MLGRYDATNIADAKVAIITNVGFDHTDGSEGWRKNLHGKKQASSKMDQSSA